MSEGRAHALDEQVAIQTPEHVAFAFDVAGIGSRTLAYVIDWLIRFVAAILITFSLFQLAGITQFLPQSWQTLQGLLRTVVLFGLMWLYMPIFEAAWEGQTPGKRIIHLRVIKDDGTPMTVLDAIIRNVLRVADFLPAFYGLGLIVMFFNRRAKRLGDFAAGTMVVKEQQYTLDQYLARDEAAGWIPTATESEQPAAALPAVLAPAEYEVVTRFLDRRGDFDAETRANLALRLAAPFYTRPQTRALAEAHADAETLLEELAGRGATALATARASRSPLGARLTAPQALDRFVQSRRKRWEHLSRHLAAIGNRGLKALTHRQLADLGRAYRQVSADHALAQTYYPGASVAGYLNRLVGTAHNTIYRRTGVTWRTLLDFYFVEVPATFRTYRRYFWLSAAAFCGPALAAFGLMLLEPQFSSLVVSPAMMDHIERQEMWTRSLWTHWPGSTPTDRVTESAAVSIWILTNNIRVTAIVFAAGMLCGAGTLYMLAMNGFLLGTLAALTWQHGMARDFWSFVTPHGVIEVSMILIGGMGGFVLGNCLLAPGRYTRRDAFRVHGRAAARLMLACVPVLFLAGWIEGTFSPMPAPFWFKQVFGLTLGLVLYTYLFGRSPQRDRAWETAGPPAIAAPAPLPPDTD